MPQVSVRANSGAPLTSNLREPVGQVSTHRAAAGAVGDLWHGGGNRRGPDHRIEHVGDRLDLAAVAFVETAIQGT